MRRLVIIALLITAGLPSTAVAGGLFGLFRHGHHHHHHGLFGRSLHFHVGRGHGYYGRHFHHRYYFPRSFVYYSRPIYRAYYPTYYPSYYYGHGCSSGLYLSGLNPVIPAASYVRSDLNYGPGAVKEFMGVGRGFALGSSVRATDRIVAASPEPAAGAVIETPAAGRGLLGPKIHDVERGVRVSTAGAKDRAAKYIGYGDAQFADQEYHSAAQRYKSAVASAPDLADAHFRQGQAYLASNRFSLAAESFRRGLRIDPLWVNSSFRLDDIYKTNRLAKNSHLDGLAQAALADRENPDYLFLLGVFLHFDGQQDRAQKFFHRAMQVTTGDRSHLLPFVIPPTPSAEESI